MKITEITIKGFKSQDRVLPIDRFNIAVGPNGSGKSAILLAAAFAATGKTPLGKTLDDTFQLADPDGCEVGVSLDDGFSFSRGITADHRTGSLSQFCGVRGRQALGLKESDAAVSEKVGRFAPMFNPNEFLALSPDKQRSMFLDLNAQARRRAGEVQDADAADLVTRAALIFLASEDELGPGTVETFITERFRIDPNTMNAEQRAQALETLLSEKVAPDRAKVLRTLIFETRREVTGELSEAIATAIAHLRDTENHSKRERDKALGAAQELSARKAARVAIAGDIEQMRAGLKLLEDQRAELVEKIGQASGRESAERSRRETIERIDKRIALLQGEIRAIEAQPEPDTAEADRLDAEAAGIGTADTHLQELRRLAENAMNATPQDTTREVAEKALKALEEETKIGNELARETESSRAFANAILATHTDIEKRKSNPWQKMYDILQQMREAVTIPAPLDAEAGALIQSQLDGPSLEKLRETKEHQQSAKGVHDAKIEALKAKHKAAIDARMALDQEVRKAREAFTAETAKAAEARKEAGQRVKDEEARLADARRRVDELKAQARDIREARERRKTAIDSRNTEIGNLQTQRAAEHAELEKLVAEAGGTSLVSLNTDKAAVEQSIAQEKSKIAAKEGYAIMDREYTQCTADAESRAVTHDVAKGLGAAVKTLRESMMQSLVAPAKRYMDRFLSVAQPDAEAYFRLENDRGTEIFETGWVRDEKRIAFAALSGCERHIFVASLCYALTMMADPPLKLLLIDADGAKLPAILRIMAAIEEIGPDISNALVTTQIDQIEGATGWNIIQCGGDESDTTHESEMAAVVAGGAVS